MIGRRPAAGQCVVVPPPKVDQACLRVVQTAVEAHHQLEVRVGVLVDLPVGGVEDLLHQAPPAGENCAGAANAVARHVVLLAAAQLHGDELTLQVVVQRRDEAAAVVVHVADPGGVGQVGVEELQLLAAAAACGHAPAQPIVAVPHRALAGPVVDAGEQTIGVVLKQVVGALPQEAVLVHAVLQLAQVRDAVALVVAQRRQSRGRGGEAVSLCWPPTLRSVALA